MLASKPFGACMLASKPLDLGSDLDSDSGANMGAGARTGVGSGVEAGAGSVGVVVDAESAVATGAEDDGTFSHPVPEARLVASNSSVTSEVEVVGKLEIYTNISESSESESSISGTSDSVSSLDSGSEAGAETET